MWGAVDSCRYFLPNECATGAMLKIYSDWWIRPVGIEGMSYKTRQVRKSYSDDG